MKKLLVLALAIVMVASMTTMVFAENTALVVQDGNRNEAVVDQDGETNDTVITQEGNANEADVAQRGVTTSALIEQLGNRNSAEVEQEGATGTGWTHEAFITQDGNDNDAVIRQFVYYHGALGTILQVGNRNMADILQNGNQFGAGSFALIEQFGNANEAKQIQTAYGSPLIKAQIYQLGDRNFADQHQRHTAYADVSELYAVQIGNANRVTQLQSEIGYGSLNRYGLAFQFGDRNEAEMTQRGHEVEHTAYAVQVGDGNKTWQTQLFGEQLGAILQMGDRNEATQYQSDGTNVGTIVQWGNANTASQTQAVGTGQGVVIQAGDRNKATQSQATGLNVATTIQVGNANTATVNQAGL
ncbi:MAG: hypothetical protein QM451_02440 [Bacillota bacterium]|jgi:hypothetical protein|nr:hypothetical protein [Bacillota bacterium]